MVLVFDGASLDAKRRTQLGRKERKQRLWKQAIEFIKKNKSRQAIDKLSKIGLVSAELVFAVKKLIQRQLKSAYKRLDFSSKSKGNKE